MSDFQLNPRSFYSQPDPAIAALPNGGLIAIWQSEYQDGHDWGIFGQRYDADGNPVGEEFQVNTTTKDAQKNPSVVALPNGGFIVTWQSRNFGGSEYDIFAQIYDASGNPIGTEFQVNTEIDNFQENPEVTVLSDGSFVIAWESRYQDGSDYGIFAQRYDASGNAVGEEFQVNTYTVYNQKQPSIAALADGGFVVTWQSQRQDGSEYGIYGQRYDGNGNAVGNQFQVNNYTNGSQNSASVAALSDGGFVVTWNSYSQDGSEYGIFAQRYDAEGNGIGNEFQVNTYTEGSQKSPSLTTLSDGGFVITWRSQGQGGTDYGVYGQRYDADGNAVDSEFQINTYETEDQGYSAVTGLADGSFAVIWHSIDAGGVDYGTYGQRYDGNGNAVGEQFQVNSYTHQLPPLEQVIPPGQGITIVIAAYNSDHNSAASANYQANGVNDQEIINDAIAQVNAAGKGTVLLLPGVFNISNNILLRSNVELRGSGWTTKLRLVDEANLDNAGIIRSQGEAESRSDIAIYNATIADLQIDGNRSNQSNIKNKYGIYGNYTDSLIENIYLKNIPYYGIDPHEDPKNGRPTTNLTIRNNLIENGGLDGITNDKVVNSLIEGNITINNDRHGINIITNAENNRYVNNISIGNGSNGITIQNGSRYIEITGNEVGENAGYGIYLDGEGNNHIQGNSVFLNGKGGILLKRSSGNAIADNLVLNNSQGSHDKYDEIELSNDEINYSTYNTIEENIIRSSLSNRARYGIREKSPTDDYNIISENIVVGPVRADYSLKGHNTTFSESSINTLLGTVANDQLRGTRSNDRLVGADGDDTLTGRSGDDLLEGGEGNDSLRGGANDDVLWGDAGNDVLKGNRGNDYLNGDDGNDQLYGSSGDDNLDGGFGDDTLDGGSDNDSIYGRSGKDFLFGDSGNDYLWGGSDNDILKGNDGNDYLVGGIGLDTLVGSAGDDIILLGGDSDQDTLLYAYGDGSDIVMSFDIGEDLFAITDISQVDIVTVGGNTEFHIADPNNFGSGDLLMTLEGVTGFTSSNISNSLSSDNTATFIFA